MCGRYWIDSEPEGELAEIIARMQRLDAPVKLAGEIFPGDSVPVICRSRGGKLAPFPMEWGFHLEGGKRIINARSETAGEKALFRSSLLERRCLVPMSAYFEWEARGRGKIKHRIAPGEGGLHCLAGLYRFEGGRPVFAVLTREAAPELAFIHDRMPVILPYAAREGWLGEAGAEALPGLCAPQMASEELSEGPQQLEMEL